MNFNRFISMELYFSLSLFVFYVLFPQGLQFSGTVLVMRMATPATLKLRQTVAIS